jgi:hypothetical protein
MVHLSGAFEEMALTNHTQAAHVNLARLRATLTPSGQIITGAGFTVVVPALPVETDPERVRLEQTHAAVMRALGVLEDFRPGPLAQSLHVAPKFLRLSVIWLWLRARLLWTQARSRRR